MPAHHAGSWQIQFNPAVNTLLNLYTAACPQSSGQAGQGGAACRADGVRPSGLTSPFINLVQPTSPLASMVFSGLETSTSA